MLNNDLYAYFEFESITLTKGSDGMETFLRQACYRKGSLIHIEFVAQMNQTVSAGQPWAVIPAKFRPSSQHNAGMFSNGGICHAGYVIVESNGIVKQSMSSNITDNTICSFMTEYYINLPV